MTEDDFGGEMRRGRQRKLPLPSERRRDRELESGNENDEDLNVGTEIVLVGEENSNVDSGSSHCVAFEGEAFVGGVANLDTVVEHSMSEELPPDAMNFGEQFGGTEKEGENDFEDDESVEDMFDDETIPKPLVYDSEEDGYYEEDEDDEEINIRQNEILAMGKTFNRAEEFKEAVLRYSLKTQYDIKLYTSTAKRVGAKCTIDGCPWKVYCSYDKNTYKLSIKSYNVEHNCVRSGYSKMLKATSIANLFEEKIRLNPNFKPSEMVDEIKREYNMNVTEYQCKRAKRVLQDRR